MRKPILITRMFSASITTVGCSVALIAFSIPAFAQAPTEPAPAGTDAHWSVAAYNTSLEQKDPLLTARGFSLQTIAGEFNEEQLKQVLVGKTLYLRDGYQDNNLEFDEYGRPTGHSPQGSFTLSQIQINRVKLSKHKLELQGDRYGLHFLGAAPFEDPTKATDRVKITPKKKTVRISFDREQVEKTKKEKKHKHKADGEIEEVASALQPLAPGLNLNQPSSEGEYKASSPAHASQLLLTALDHVFSIGIDDRMIADMPDFWRLYYQAAAVKADFKPLAPGILHQNAVDLKAKLISVMDPPSNEFAQSSGIAGMALYHAVIGSDGKVQQVVAGRPIGFGLDENAEKTIRAATFQPALKEGKPVSVSLDLIVSFRIYSKRTSQFSTQQASETPSALPGPYTAQALEARAQQQPDAAPQQPQPTSPH